MLVNSWMSVLLILWVVAVIAAVAAAIYVWQKDAENKRKRTLFCVMAMIVYAIPGLLFLLAL